MAENNEINLTNVLREWQEFWDNQFNQIEEENQMKGGSQK